MHFVNTEKIVWVCLIGNSKANLPSSENGRLRRDGNTVPNQTQNSSKQQISDLSSRRRGFQLKNTKTSLVLSNASKVASFSEFCKYNRESLKSLPNLLSFEAEGLARLPNLPNLPFSELGKQSNTNSESSKSTVSELIPIKHTLEGQFWSC